ncbi:MAG: PLP-dependent aminotransferase family protein [Hamadaea sp.]|uniref:MocR-like pyridoxine biosynthesis transcription factor PdxR n=1 Tax=Hamadaea sp. TaxID=2024425 RepID=UPI001815E139|nr:PLP-dependent aminotransferase family protein [Hamadaea sp.]NUR74089.1 PLP-dependent aminotransferase family protein [Hamadaea sp.]NUT20233.1 PLP-dependent aminotransferase family protein [Hamadaea sp.]
MAGNRTNSPRVGELRLDVRRDVPVALHRQIAAAVRAHIRSGRLPIGSSLPPTRLLAADLGVSRGVVIEAYAQLTAEGYLASRPGGYTEVAGGVREPADRPPVIEPAAYRIDFSYGRADVAHFPRQAWLRSFRQVLTTTSTPEFALLSGRGAPALRTALADYLNRVRGTVADPRNIVITNGFAQGIRLLIQVLADQGATRLALEDPAPDDDARPAALRAGLAVIGVPVDEQGILTDGLDDVDADTLVLAPSHQWPVGGALPAARRAAVVRWACERNALLIEDDYDAEYRFDRDPLGALQGLAPEQVAYAGTLSKTLAPGVRIGWLVLPEHLTDAVAEAKIAADRGSATLEQLALADFLVRGEFDRHTRRMRPLYRARREALVAALHRHLPGARPAGIAAGLHLLVWLPPDLDEQELADGAAKLGVFVQPLSRYRIAPVGDRRGALILGYSVLSESAIAEGIALLGEAARRLRR